MNADGSHIREIKVVSNTHWDREFRLSFEKTRRSLVDLLDSVLDLLEQDPRFHSYVLDGHAIILDDYLEIRPEKKDLVCSMLKEGRLVAGPYFTLVEEFSVSHEALVRNLLFGQKCLRRYGVDTGSVAYTPSSWGQTGQLPQILSDFGLKYMMFYRGISHDEADAEYVWRAPDGTEVLASRFALYARYNWYYQVHRKVTRGRAFEKDYIWGEFDEVPFRIVDGLSDSSPSFKVLRPSTGYNRDVLKESVEAMVKTEGAHFTTPIFLAMNGHDMSFSYPLESDVISDANEFLKDRFQIRHTDLEGFWRAVEEHVDRSSLRVLTGERRSRLRKGMWTFLFPGTISARINLKQMDFEASRRLSYEAEPLASLAYGLGQSYPRRYLDRGWHFLLQNHTHDANGGCAPDSVCSDMEYRYRQSMETSALVSEESMEFVAENLAPLDSPKGVQLIAFNPLPFQRSSVVDLDLEIPGSLSGKGVSVVDSSGDPVDCQSDPFLPSSAFVDNRYDVPTILDTRKARAMVELKGLPSLGYRVYKVSLTELEDRSTESLVVADDRMENEHILVKVEKNGTVSILHKATDRWYRRLNYLIDQGEAGDAWKHIAPTSDRHYTSKGLSVRLSVCEDGRLRSRIRAEYCLEVPESTETNGRSDRMIGIPVTVDYILERGNPYLKVRMTVENRARDHWLRAAFPTELATDSTEADSHFDVVSRSVPLPDSTGWVEPAGGTHPLRTFVDMSDGERGFALISKGLFEYEALDNGDHTLMLTLIRACRIRLAVSEEKKTELPDVGIQCPGTQTFEYALMPHKGDYAEARLLNLAAEYFSPVRCVIAGSGKGSLPHETSLISLADQRVHVTCVKQAEDGRGLVVRFFNPLAEAVDVDMVFGFDIVEAHRTSMSEVDTGELRPAGNRLCVTAEAKKVVTLRVVGRGMEVSE